MNDDNNSEDQGPVFRPLEYGNLNEIMSPPPVQNPEGYRIGHFECLEDFSTNSKARDDTSDIGPRDTPEMDGSSPGSEYDAPANYVRLTEVSTGLPVENPDETGVYRHHNLEEDLETASRRASAVQKPSTARKLFGSRFQTQLFTISHLIFFSILGTLARLGLVGLTTYTGAPVVFGNLWPNAVGSMILGFLSEGAQIFGHPALQKSIARRQSSIKRSFSHRGRERSRQDSRRPSVIRRASMARFPVPLHIGLATGFCGSFTTFSGFIEDCFLALANSLPAPTYHPGATSGDLASRPPGDSFMAVVAVILITLTLSCGFLKAGAHIAILLHRWGTSRPLPGRLFYYTDRAVVLVAPGVWLGAVIMAIFPPDRHSDSLTGGAWRGEVLLPVVFAPLGCLVRFFTSIKLNSALTGFPLGTFLVNMLGVVVASLAWDFQRLPSMHTKVVGCQLLQGVIDGFCGCLTTVSTWVLELSILRRGHAYVYGLASMAGGLILAILTMGLMKWTVGWGEPAC